MINITNSAEYNLIKIEYGDRCTKRSQVPLINHIDQGLVIMSAVGASEVAMRAFCLHPLLQNNADLLKHYELVATKMATQTGGALVLALAMEYRATANAYLAHRRMPGSGIKLSPLKDVNDMLIGDKVQNRKDFELYHAAKHWNRVRLAQYFDQWLAALGVAHRYDELKTLIIKQGV